MKLKILKRILDFLKTKKSVKYSTLVLSSGGITGFFVYSLLAQYNVIFESSTTLLSSVILFSAIYFFAWILFSLVISSSNKIDLLTVLRQDAISYSPSILFLFYSMRTRFLTLDPFAAVNVAADAINVLGKFLFLLVISSTFSLKILFFGINERYEKKLQTYFKKFSTKIVYIFVALFFLTFSILAIRGFNAFSTTMDLAIYDQAVWNSLRGRFFESSLQQGISLRGPVVKSRITLFFHLELILLLLTPFYIIYQSPITLMILQIFLLSLGALPVYWLSRDILNSEIAGVVLSFSYLSFPALNYIALYDFHPIAFTTPFLLFALYFLHKKDYIKVFPLLILTMLCKENASLIVFMIGCYVLFIKKERIFGSIISLLGVLWFYLALFVVIPYFSKGADFYYFGRYSYLGNNFIELFKTIILHPIFVLKHVLIFPKIGYMLLLFVPLGFISILGPTHLLIATPIFAQNLLSTHAFQYSIYAQYNSLIIPFLFISAIYGIKRFSGNKNKFFSILFFILINSLLANFFFSPSPLNFLSPFPLSSRGFRLEEYTINSHDRVAYQIIELIPNDASVSTGQKFLAHLNHRENIFIFPGNFDRNFDNVDYLLLDTREQKSDITKEIQLEHIQRLLESNEYYILAEEDGIFLLKLKDGI